MNRDAKKILKISSLAALLIFIAVYAFFRSKDLLFGVKIRDITVNELNPEITTIYTDPVVNITGNAKNAKELLLNNRIISIDQQGNFSEKIALSIGYNIIGIVAKDGFGNTDAKDYKLIYVKKS